jgi:hypothetical protein
MPFRFVLYLYSLIAISLLVTSVITTSRAKRLTGEDYYLFTRTHVFVDRYVPPRNATDAALDEAQADDNDEHDSGIEIDRPGVMSVDQPLFVLGYLDVTGPFIFFGGLVLLMAGVARKALRKRRILALQST